MFGKYDVIVVGGGHAGNEAAAAAAKLGSSTLLITMNMQNIGQMSCNPAMGGVAKGQIIREIDALGGLSGIVSDKTMIQFRMLNKSKGPAMWSPRCQNDRWLFAQEWRLQLEAIDNLDFWQDMVTGLIIEDKTIKGVTTMMGMNVYAKTVIITSGTFLNGVMHIGSKNFKGGRTGEKASFGITEQLVEHGFVTGRMKTGTPPRVDGRSLDYTSMEEQKGDAEPSKFSFTDTPKLTKQRSCWITYTNPAVHETLKKGFEDSPMFSGQITGLGPRYCPSIEDKINRFAERQRHQIFVEPEGWDTVEIYVNGFSTSLPEEIQLQALRQIKGFEQVKMFRPGYAIEYDFFQPTQLYNSLETKNIDGLFFAGQINGTTGYEEAACQGLMAGINAHHKINGIDPFVLKRSQAYIGVLIDDLINLGTNEPYRMFTSRAEFRLLLRQDNADLRLTKLGHQIGLINDTRLAALKHKEDNIQILINDLKHKKLTPQEVNTTLEKQNTAGIKEKSAIMKLLKRPQINISHLSQDIDSLRTYLQRYTQEEIEQAEIMIKYEDYFEKEKSNVSKMEELEDYTISEDFDYLEIKALSIESREKLHKIRPKTIGQASRISGVSKADITVLMIYLTK